MVKPHIFFLLVLMAFIFTIRFAESISCYQCNSTDINTQFHCTEEMEDIGNLRPQPCTNLNNAAYCVKHVGLYNGGLGVRRYCSSHNLGNYCNNLKRPGDEFEYRTCFYTCDTDGCNGPGELKLHTYLESLSIFKWFQNLQFQTLLH